jgi:hypothetical protein
MLFSNAYFHSDGREYPVTVEYFERGGDAALSLSIQAIEPALGHSDSQLGNFKKAIVLGNSVKFQYDNGYVLQYADGSTSRKFYDKPHLAQTQIADEIRNGSHSTPKYDRVW